MGDEQPQSEEFVVGDSFARGPDRDDAVARLRVRPRRPDPALQRGVRAGDRVHARRGHRAQRARRRHPARGARRVRRVPGLRLDRADVEPAGRPLDDEGRRTPADRLVEPADGRRRGSPGVARHDRDRPDRPRAAPRIGRAGAAGRAGRQAGRDQPAGRRAALAAPRGDARRLRGVAGAGLHGGLGGVRAGAGGQRVRRRALRGRRLGDDRRAPQPRRHRRLPARGGPRGGDPLRARARARVRDARARGRLGRALRADRRGDVPRRLPLDGGGADRRARRAVGRRRDRQRGPAAAGDGEPPRRVLRAGVAGGRERAGARGPHRVARASRARAATSSAGGWSATSTTARSRASCRSR